MIYTASVRQCVNPQVIEHNAHGLCLEEEGEAAYHRAKLLASSYADTHLFDEGQHAMGPIPAIETNRSRQV
jgi:hypothetical protein